MLGPVILGRLSPACSGGGGKEDLQQRQDAELFSMLFLQIPPAQVSQEVRGLLTWIRASCTTTAQLGMDTTAGNTSRIN